MTRDPSTASGRPANRNYVAASLRLTSDMFDLVATGRKSSTVRRGQVLFEALRIPLISGERHLPVRILRLDYSKTVADLSEDDASRDGFSSRSELLSTLHRFYPDLADDEPVTVVHFEVEHGGDSA